MTFQVGDEVVVVRVRDGLDASVGDRARVIRVSPDYGSRDDPCTTIVEWLTGRNARHPHSASYYDNQFELVGGPW